MKKLIVSALIFLSMLININNVIPVSAATTLKQGVYSAKDFSFPAESEHYIKNISPNEELFVVFADENLRIIQAVKLSPNSPKFNLITLNPNFSIAILGKGELSIE
ncbi:hypothetical protein [Clostridium sp. YIM B02551]|uniref:hypothetical protein n=1 Tax=Clostridium sp. YIM B02551 TaxID=2910679 RepID=UPI001EEA99CE|nr:hypothetical protein [Clostridium sp. YIM B02551]